MDEIKRIKRKQYKVIYTGEVDLKCIDEADALISAYKWMPNVVKIDIKEVAE